MTINKDKLISIYLIKSEKFLTVSRPPLECFCRFQPKCEIKKESLSKLNSIFEEFFDISQGVNILVIITYTYKDSLR